MRFLSNFLKHTGILRCLWTLLFWTQMLWTCWGISVSFPYQNPIYIATGRRLVLQAQLTLKPGEVVRLLTWDHKNGAAETRLKTDPNPEPNIDKVQFVMDKFPSDRYGFYTLTVTNFNGDQTTAVVEVRQSQTPPQTSLHLQCIITPEGTLLESPLFSWWVNGRAVNKETARLSADGSSLALLGQLDDNYTCAVDSTQGSTQVQIIRDPGPDPKPCPSSCCTALIVIAVIELVVIMGLSYGLHKFWKKSQSPSRNEVNY